MAVLRKDIFYIATDAVVFTILGKEFKILIIKRRDEPYKNQYALPGGFLNIDEEIEDCAKRELEEETGVKNIYLQKLEPVGDVGRDPRGRVISIPFLALIDSERIRLVAGDDAIMANWHPVYDLPQLGFDHNTIVESALKRLRFNLLHSNIAFQIMPEKFTLSELQNAYELILEKKLDKRNFRKKIRELGMLRELKENRMDGPHRPAVLHSFKDRIFKEF